VETEVLSPEVSEVERLATLGINVRCDADLLKVWLKSRQDVRTARHTVRFYRRIEPGYGSKWHEA
jgi:hypothetical protein